MDSFPFYLDLFFPPSPTILLISTCYYRIWLYIWVTTVGVYKLTSRKWFKCSLNVSLNIITSAKYVTTWGKSPSTWCISVSNVKDDVFMPNCITVHSYCPNSVINADFAWDCSWSSLSQNSLERSTRLR